MALRTPLPPQIQAQAPLTQRRICALPNSPSARTGSRQTRPQRTRALQRGRKAEKTLAPSMPAPKHSSQRAAACLGRLSSGPRHRGIWERGFASIALATRRGHAGISLPREIPALSLKKEKKTDLKITSVFSFSVSSSQLCGNGLRLEQTLAGTASTRSGEGSAPRLWALT